MGQYMAGECGYAQLLQPAPAAQPASFEKGQQPMSHPQQPMDLLTISHMYESLLGNAKWRQDVPQCKSRSFSTSERALLVV